MCTGWVGRNSTGGGAAPRQVTSNFVTYKITGSEFVFANFVPDCKSTLLCDIVEITSTSAQEAKTTVPAQFVHAFDVNRFPVTCLITSKPNLSVLFMACLQEGVGARFVARFRVSTNFRSDRTLFVLYEPKN
uniref:AlNc14C285G10167 protein n=1 Tax=Albugo laibachii Nc14 TaxID=890382 RepID=F0WV21_9STRA|nr:AlNc14C285G10167 [Albugo laibachii Nc14]|eukprot:CCA25258.1 AlNc14C285G10167 [Albugo laibachii Nc14]